MTAMKQGQIGRERSRDGVRLWSAGWLAFLVSLVLLVPPASAQLFMTPTTFTTLTAVGQSSQPVTVNVPASASGTVSTVTALTGSQPNLDFAVTPITCTVNAQITAGTSCTVSVTFTPRLPGIRQGVVVLEDSAHHLLGSASLSGIGGGGLPVLAPGEINTVAGNGQWIYQMDGVKAVDTSIFLPTGLAVDASGNLYLCDSSNNRVRRVDAVSGLISTVAGNGNPGSQGDNGQAVAAELSDPSGLALDGAGNLYIADSGNNVIRRVDAVSGVITTIAGQIGYSGYTGDGTAATAAKLLSPQGLALTPAGDLIIADSGNNAVRQLTMSTGIITTIAGTGVAGFNNDGIPATQARLNNPYGVAVRTDGAIAIADMANQRVRLVDATGFISTIAGSGARSFTGDNGAATQAALDGPAAVAFDPAGDLFIADSGNNRVRGVFGHPGVIVTLAGNGNTAFAGDGFRDDQASLNGPYALFFDSVGNLWVSDFFHNRVREISGSLLGLQYPVMKVGKTSSPIVGALFNGGNVPLTLHNPTLNQAALDPGTTTCNQSPMAPMSFCNMGLEFAPTQTGNPANGSVTWTSDAPNVTPVDALSGQVLSVEPTTVAVTGSPNPGLLGMPVVLTATVTSDDTGRTGTVTFSEGGTNWCTTVPLAADGTASCTIGSLSLGSHSFVANYSGDDNNAASTSPAYVEIIKQQPALALAVSSSPAVVTSNVTLTLNAADQNGTPTGNVVFFDGTTPLATVALNSSGIATWSTQTLTVGAHSLSAQYAGDSANAAGTSNTVTEQVNQANTLTVASSSNSNATVGTPVSFTSHVVSNDGPAPTGSVQFTDGSGAGATVLGSSTLATDGTASITVVTLLPGTHNIVASYSGDTDDAASNSTPLVETIQQIATVTTAGADANPLDAGAALHLTATVSLTPGASADGGLTGNVTFADGQHVLGSAPINAAGQATLTVNSLNVGSHTITAAFGGSTNYAPSTSNAINETVQQTATQITLSSSSANTLLGEPASFTVAVSSATGVPTGTVNLRDGATVIATAPLDANGHASFSTSRLSQGTHTLTAVYGGDANYVSATSAGVQQNVQLAQPTLTLSGPSNAVDAGTNATFVAALTTPGTAPTGTLTLRDGGAAVGTLTVSSNGNFTFNTSLLSIGTHTLTAFYGGNTDNATATSTAVTVTIKQANSATALTSNTNPLTQGGALTLTANVTSDSPNASGQLNFYDGSTLLGSAALNANGAATFSPTNLTLGTHALTAVYAGDTNHSGSTSAPLSELVVQGSSATLNSNNNPSQSGQSVVFTVQIYAAKGTGAASATGTVSFRDNGVLLAAVPLNGAGAASFATEALGVGTHTITVTYAGDTNYASTGAQLTQIVTDAGTQTALAASTNPATYAQSLLLSATVTSNGGLATGTVNFTDGAAIVGSAQLNGNGVAVLTIATLAPGAHTIVANYVGDGKASPSTSSPLALVVKQTTVLALSSNSNPIQTLSPVSLTVTLTNGGAALATGSVTFSDGNTVIGTAALDATGHATLTMPGMAAGTHGITATYAGDGANFASNSPVFNETVQLRPTTTTVTGSLTDPSNPQQVTLIAVVKGQGSTAPTGPVTFTSGSVTLGVAAIDDTGVATITVILETRTEPVIASYAGDASYTPSTSVSTPITAGQAAQFTLATNVPSVTLATHQHTTVNVNLGSVKGFTDTIELGCEGLPFAATCTFSQSQLKLLPDGTATASLILDTGDPLGAGSGTTASITKSRNTLLCWLPVGLLLGLVQRKRTRAARRRLGTLLVFAIAFALTLGATGCSGLSTSGTPAGTYSFKVIGTGMGSGTTQAQSVTMVVTQ